MSKELKSVKRTPTNKDEPIQSKNLNDPRSVFLGSALSMSWQLAIVVLVPIVGGYKIDQHLKNTDSAFFLIGLLIAVIGMVVVIRHTLQEFDTSFTKPGVTKK